MTGPDRLHHAVAAGRFSVQVNEIDRRIVENPAHAEEVDRIHDRDPASGKPVFFDHRAGERGQRLLVGGVIRIIIPVIVPGMGGADRAVMFMDEIDRLAQIAVDFFIGKDAAGEFLGIGIRIDAHREHVIIVVAALFVTVMPVERVIFLTVEEQDFVIGIFLRVQFAVVGGDVFHGYRADVVAHVTHDRIDGAGRGIAAVPVERMHVDGELVIFLDRKGRFGRFRQNLRLAAEETVEIRQQIADIFFPEGEAAFRFGSPVFGEEDLIEEDHPFSAFRTQDESAVADGGIHVGPQDLPVRIGEETGFGGGPNGPSGIRGGFLHDTERIRSNFPVEHFIGSDFFRLAEQPFAGSFDPGHHIAHVGSAVGIFAAVDGGHMAVDQLGVADFLGQEIRRPAAVILMHEEQNAAAPNPVADIEFVIFDIVVESVLFNQHQIEFLKISGIGIVDFSRFDSLFLQEINESVTGLEPVGEITDFEFVRHIDEIPRQEVQRQASKKERLCQNLLMISTEPPATNRIGIIRIPIDSHRLRT